MIIRFVQVRIVENSVQWLKLAYEREVIPPLRSVEGCLSASLLQLNADPQECVSMTTWRSAEDVQRYEQSGTFHQLIEVMRPYFAESTEWNIQLGSDMTIQYEPVPMLPTVRNYDVELHESPAPDDDEARRFVRIVSHRIRQGADAEFRRIYENEVLPTLRKQTACRRAYLVADPGDPTKMLSVTVWRSQLDAEEYERGGHFAALLAKLKPALTTLTQWKLSVSGHQGKTIATSDDVTVEGFDLLVGERF